MKRFNNYLLTHHPLLWNTRVVWVLAVTFILHLLFFAAGYASVSTQGLKNYYSLGRIGGESMYVFAVLCSLLVIIVWCVYYLRNNAFKSWYCIGRWYLAKEFGIIFLVILSSITYSLSFNGGAALHVRGITPYNQMLEEMNAVSTAMVYVPLAQTPYFVRNTCDEKRRRRVADRGGYYDGEVSVPESATPYYGADSTEMFSALKQPGALSYLHYCKEFFTSSSAAIDSADVVSARNRAWLQNGGRDSVRQSLLRLFAILDRYGVQYKLNAEALTAAVFKDSLHTLSTVIATNVYPGDDTRIVTDHLYSSELVNVYGLVEDAHGGPHTDRLTEWNVVGYVALLASILLLCYRRFSKRVFLISVVGALVWSILVGLLTIGLGSSNGFAVLVLMLAAVFITVALVALYSGRNKTVAGAAFNWHAFLSPFVVMLVYTLIEDWHRHRVPPYGDSANSKEVMRGLHPFSTWVTEHAGEIFLVNIVAVALYIAFAFNHWAKRWHLMTEE